MELKDFVHDIKRIIKLRPKVKKMHVFVWQPEQDVLAPVEKVIVQEFTMEDGGQTGVIAIEIKEKNESSNN